MSASYLRLLPLLLCAGSSLVFAAEDQQNITTDFYNLSLADLGKVQISIATGNSTPLDKAPATASVISAAEIDVMGARNLDEILETVPGLHVSLSSLSRLDSVYSIRGIHTGFNSQVLLMLNGVPVQFSLQGRPTLFRLPVTSIARVEVIRGPGSAVYGADAYAGVINVITKDAVAIEGTEVGARAGSFNSHDVWLQSATQWQGVGIAFNLAYQESDGDANRRIDSDLQSFLDSKLGTHASLAPGALSTRYQLLDTHLALSTEQLQLNLWNWHSSNAGVGAGGAQALDPEGKDDSDLRMADLTYHFGKGLEHWDNSIRASYLSYNLESKFHLLPSGTVLPIGSDGNLNFVAPAGIVQFSDGLIGNPSGLSNDTQVDFTSLFTGWDSHRLRLAAGARRQTLVAHETKNFGPGVIDGTAPVVDGTVTNVSNSAFVFLADSARNLRYLSLQDEWRILADVELTAGLRYDDYSDFGSTTNPRVALVWTADEKFTTKLLYGSAFRAPSFAELYFRNNPVTLGNSNLKPEHIDTVELSFNYRATPNLQTTLTLFDYQAQDMIEFLSDAGATTKTAQNARDQNGKGFELEVNWKPFSQLHFSGSYSQQDATDAKTNTTIPYAPGQQCKINANWEFVANWYFNSQLNWVADRERAVGDLRPRISNYTLLNFTLHRKNILPDLDVSIALHNASNADAREPSSGEIPHDYPLETRSAWLELSYSLK